MIRSAARSPLVWSSTGRRFWCLSGRCDPRKAQFFNLLRRTCFECQRVTIRKLSTANNAVVYRIHCLTLIQLYYKNNFATGPVKKTLHCFSYTNCSKKIISICFKFGVKNRNFGAMKIGIKKSILGIIHTGYYPYWVLYILGIIHTGYYT